MGVPSGMSKFHPICPAEVAAGLSATDYLSGEEEEEEEEDKKQEEDEDSEPDDEQNGYSE